MTKTNTDRRIIKAIRPESLPPLSDEYLLSIELSLEFMEVNDAINVMLTCKDLYDLDRIIPFLLKQSAFQTSIFSNLVRDGNMKVVKWFREAGLTSFFREECCEAKWGGGIRVLTAAASHGHKDLVDAILAEVSYSDVNFVGDHEYTHLALYHASIEGHTDIVQSLLNAGSDPNIWCVCGYYDKETPLFAVIRYDYNKADIINLLLAAGADANLGGLTDKSCAGGYRATPLLLAIAAGQEEAVQILIQNNANVDLAGYEVDIEYEDSSTIFDTPLSLASQLGQRGMVKALLDAGANPDKLDINTEDRSFGDDYEPPCYGIEWLGLFNSGVAPIWKAAFRGHKEIVEILIEAGANVDKSANLDDDQTTITEITTIDAAVLQGHKGIVAKLLNSGANVTNTILNVTETGQKYIIEALLAENKGGMITSDTTISILSASTVEIDYCLSLRFCLDKLEQHLSIDEGDQENDWLSFTVLLKHEAGDYDSCLSNRISENDKKKIRNMIQNTKRCYKEEECKTKLAEIEASIAKPIIEGWKVLYKQIVKLLISASYISELPDDRVNVDIIM